MPIRLNEGKVRFQFVGHWLLSPNLILLLLLCSIERAPVLLADAKARYACNKPHKVCHYQSIQSAVNTSTGARRTMFDACSGVNSANISPWHCQCHWASGRRHKAVLKPAAAAVEQSEPSTETERTMQQQQQLHSLRWWSRRTEAPDARHEMKSSISPTHQTTCILSYAIYSACACLPRLP